MTPSGRSAGNAIGESPLTRATPVQAKRFMRELEVTRDNPNEDTEHWADLESTVRKRLEICSRCPFFSSLAQSAGCLKATDECVKCLEARRDVAMDSVAYEKARCPIGLWGDRSGK